MSVFLALYYIALFYLLQQSHSLCECLCIRCQLIIHIMFGAIKEQYLTSLSLP